MERLNRIISTLKRGEEVINALEIVNEFYGVYNAYSNPSNEHVDDLYDAIFRPRNVVMLSRNRFDFYQNFTGWTMTVLLYIMDRISIKIIDPELPEIAKYVRLLTLLVFFSHFIPLILKDFFRETLQILPSYKISFKRLPSIRSGSDVPMIFKYFFIFHWIMAITKIVPIEHELVQSFLIVLPDRKYYLSIYIFSFYLASSSIAFIRNEDLRL